MEFCFSVWFVPAAFLYNAFHCCMYHRYSGVLSAYGLALADVVEEVQEPCSLQYEQRYFPEIDQRVEQLSKRCRDTLCARGFSRSAPTKHLMCLCFTAILSSLYYMLFHCLKNPSVISDGIMQLYVLVCLQRSDNHRSFPSSTLPRHRLCPHGHGRRLPQQRPVLSSRRLPQQLHQTVSC